MTDAQRLRERVVAAATGFENVKGHPIGTRILAAVVDELGITGEMVEYLASVRVKGAIKPIGSPDLGEARDQCCNALRTLLDASKGENGD